MDGLVAPGEGDAGSPALIPTFPHPVYGLSTPNFPRPPRASRAPPAPAPSRLGSRLAVFAFSPSRGAVTMARAAFPTAGRRVRRAHFTSTASFTTSTSFTPISSTSSTSTEPPEWNDMDGNDTSRQADDSGMLSNEEVSVCLIPIGTHTHAIGPL